ncbi:quinolinate synthase A [Thermosipho melanesiensis]|uniref:Quinolinate synthase n=2 Tax=Thermosipho melanesiensis TaxID=46541 RepID=A6LNC6_THEM4|nr:quinolinate synthase NadA [Thermosipho melanesiensis]ABR31427.1 quinolinate synthetase complex, A subunit [Thermosipho melanesiensis BI429]APT74486.1 Quinolinate synthase A [Thermosipho melanesiensis]OOC36445.1 quinolinate synthase A [Thermosipho melanesiensis]OOC37263.1 quinolinate synthase A [Thermosipho melanesiensis]OOC38015.1 quinolinate synthase A [Thermosipho melanesiensis]
MVDLKEKIKRIAKEKGYVILAHNYQNKDIQDIADYLGDSLQLAKIATKIESDKILFLGVDFMAEAIKILNSNKKVIVPIKAATCPMANSLEPEMIIEAKEKYKAPFVIYVNSTASSKMYADYACTSANAVEIVKKIKSEIVLFGPDKNLAEFVAEKTGKKVIPIPGDTGYCYVHNYIRKEEVLSLKEKYPNAKVISHPEVSSEIQAISDYVGSTSQMEKFPNIDEGLEYIIVTEKDMVEKLKKIYPDRTFIPISSAVCNNMKKNTLKNILSALENEQFEVLVDEEIAKKAIVPIENMFKLMEE